MYGPAAHCLGTDARRGPIRFRKNSYKGSTRSWHWQNGRSHLYMFYHLTGPKLSTKSTMMDCYMLATEWAPTQNSHPDNPPPSGRPPMGGRQAKMLQAKQEKGPRQRHRKQPESPTIKPSTTDSPIIESPITRPSYRSGSGRSALMGLLWHHSYPDPQHGRSHREALLTKGRISWP